ncbi:MAG: hypothetical protein LUD50_03550 [Clostridia bacterium]|nr:hypothetical protein [Clostridia bacterium]
MMKEFKAYINNENREGFRKLFADHAGENLSVQDIDAIILSEAAYALGEQDSRAGKKVFNKAVHDQIREILMEGISEEDIFPLLILMLDGNDVEISFKNWNGVNGEVLVGARSYRPKACPKSFTVLVPVFDDDDYEDEGGDGYDEVGIEYADAEAPDESIEDMEAAAGEYSDDEYENEDDSDEYKDGGYEDDEDEDYEDDSYIIHAPDDPTVIWPADENEKRPVIDGVWKCRVRIKGIDKLIAYLDWTE